MILLFKSLFALGIERVLGYILPENHVVQRVCRKLAFEVIYDASQDAFSADIEIRTQRIVVSSS